MDAEACFNNKTPSRSQDAVTTVEINKAIPKSEPLMRRIDHDMKRTNDGTLSHITSLENTANCAAPSVSWFNQINIIIDAEGSERNNAPNRLFHLVISLAATTTSPEKNIPNKIFCHSMGRYQRWELVVFTPIPGVENHSYFVKKQRLST